MTKADDAIKYAEVAQQMAGSAQLTATVQGIMFESLITVLRDSNAISKDDIEHVFLVAAAVIDDSNPTSEAARQNVESMRNAVERVASAFGVTVPPPGQTGIPRKQ